MPLIDKHLKTSLDKTGREYKDIHEWLDKDPEKKAERHDITKMYDYGKMIEEKYGKNEITLNRYLGYHAEIQGLMKKSNVNRVNVKAGE